MVVLIALMYLGGRLKNKMAFLAFGNLDMAGRLNYKVESKDYFNKMH